jgi:hypothetical protein
MLFISHWTLRPEHRNATLARFKETGGKPPPGIKMLGRWHAAAGDRGLAVFETNDAAAIGKWSMEWNDLLSIETFPVHDDQELAKILT